MEPKTETTYINTTEQFASGNFCPESFSVCGKQTPKRISVIPGRTTGYLKMEGAVLQEMQMASWEPPQSLAARRQKKKLRAINTRKPTKRGRFGRILPVSSQTKTPSSWHLDSSLWCPENPAKQCWTSDLQNYTEATIIFVHVSWHRMLPVQDILICRNFSRVNGKKWICWILLCVRV